MHRITCVIDCTVDNLELATVLLEINKIAQIQKKLFVFLILKNDWKRAWKKRYSSWKRMNQMERLMSMAHISSENTKCVVLCCVVCFVFRVSKRVLVSLFTPPPPSPPSAVEQ